MGMEDYQKKQIGIFSKLNAEKQAELSVSLNQFYQDRIEKLRTRLWGTLTWLAAAQGAALLLIIKEGGLRTVTVRAVKMEEPILVLLVAFFGLILAIYMLAIIRNGHVHLTSNFENSNFALNLPYIAPPAPGSSADELCEARRKVWAEGKMAAEKPDRDSRMELPFRIMRILGFAAVVLDLLLMIVGGVGVWEWFSGKDVPYILITPLSRE